MSQIQQIIGADGSQFNTPWTVSDSGELVQHAVIQYVNTEQENIDPHNSGQVVMLQPISMAADGSLIFQDGQPMDPGQFQIQSLENGGFQTLEVDPNTLQQLQLDTTSGQLLFAPLQEQQNQVVQTQHVEIVQQPLIDENASPEQSTITLSIAPPAPKGRKPKEPEIQPPVGKGPYPCPKCGTMFQKWAKLRRHLKQHEEDKPHKCNQCDETFNMLDNLKLHIATHNTDDPTCPECGKKFSRIASLKAHLMMHEKEETLMCPECGDEYMLQSQLERHLEEHREEEIGGKNYPCKNCSMVFGKLVQLRTHMKQHVKVKASLHHKSYKKNIDRSRFKHKCKFCDKLFMKPSQLERHVRVHTGERPFVCATCQKAFNQKGALQLHMVKHTGEKSFPCNFCNKMFAQKGNLRCHIRRVHSHSTDGGVELFHCEECSCTFKKLGSLNAHMSREHSDHQEIILKVESGPQGEEDTGVTPRAQQATVTLKPGQRLDQGVSIVRDAIEQLLDLTEKPQQKSNEDGGQDEAHMDGEDESSADIIKQALESSGLPSTRNNQENTAEGDEVLITPTVTEGGDSTIPSQLHFQVPMSLLERLPPAKREGVIATMSIHDPATGTMKRHVIRKIQGVRWHQCTYCTKEFKKPSDLIRHVRIHTHEKPYKCHMCFRMFAVKSTLTAHLKTHTGVKEYRCHVCDKLFSTHGSLKVHLRLHTGAKPFDCPHCEKKFRTSGHRKTHIQTHFRDHDVLKQKSPRRTPRKIAYKQEAPIIPDIPLQEPIMITDAGLIQQTTKNTAPSAFPEEHSSMDRPYRCGYCTRGFKKSSHLKQHIRSHTGEKPYKCLQCFKSFVSSGVLKAHIRTHTGIKAYKCQTCEATFTTKGSLKRHISVHSDTRPFMCPYCQKTFKRSVYCKKHMRIHRAELAMQAMQEQSGQNLQQPETEVTIGGDDEDHVDVGDGHEEIEEIEVPASQDDLTNLAQGQILIQDAHGNLTLHQPGEFTTTHTGIDLGQHAVNQGVNHIDLGQQTGNVESGTVELVQGSLDHVEQASLQDAIVSDVQLQSAIQQQFGNQVVLTTEPLQMNQVQLQQQQQQQHQVIHQPQTSIIHTTQPTDLLQSHNGGTVFQGLADQTFITADGTHIALNQISLTGPNQLELTGNNLAQSASRGQPLTANMQSILQTVDNMEAGEGQEEIEGMVTMMEYTEEEEHEPANKIPGGDEEDDEKRNYKCSYCMKAFKKSSHLKQHVRSHTGDRPYKCFQCDKFFVSAGVLKAHLKTHVGNKDFKCDICTAEFTTNGSLTRHMVSHRATRPYKCTYCSETFKSPLAAKKHVRTHKEENVEESDQDADPQKRTRPTNLVTISDEQAEELANTNMKENMQLSEKLLIESANERSRISELKNESILDDEPKHANQCSHCPKSFKKPSDLVRHERIHTGEKPFGCDICGRAFTVRSTLNSHIMTHQKVMKEYRCHVCDTYYSTKGSLKVHMRLHTGARPFKCPHCQEKFRTSGHRKSHIETHFRTVVPKKRKHLDEKPKVQRHLTVLEQNIPADDQNSHNPDIQLDPLVAQGQGVLPVSLSITDSFGNVADPHLAAQVLQGLEGIQLQLQGPQGIQISGLDGGLLSQPLQIDSSLLSQLQNQGGNVSISLNPGGMFGQHTLQAADPNLIQNVQQFQQVSLGTAVNPNVIIQSSTDTTQMPDIQLVQEETQNIEGMSIKLHVEEPVVDNNVILKAPEEIEEEEEEEDTEEQDIAADNLNYEDTFTTFTHEHQPDEDSKTMTEEQLLAIQLLETQATKQTQPDDDLSERIHICNVCSKAFKRSSHLKEHMQIHVQGPGFRSKNTPHQCTQCQKSFQKPSQLERHMRIHTGERPYVCEICKKSFNQKNALHIHLKKHTGEKPHQCEYCQMSFSQKGNLKVHIKRYHHGEMMDTMYKDARPHRTITTSDGNLVENEVSINDTAIVNTITGENIPLNSHTTDAISLDLTDINIISI